ncbi:hypothetical protein [Collinsella aerofaciens]|uniref:hypothetical protein n=1 Tax=Collinsella aerofaciens TaxID=74426 RepID=UPI003D7B8FFC
MTLGRFSARIYQDSVELVRASSVQGMLESFVVRMDHAAQVRHVGNRGKVLQP